MYSKLLLTLDGSELARGAVAHAAELAGDSAAEVAILEVIDGPEVLRMRMLTEAYEMAGSNPDELAQSAHFTQKQAAERHLEAAAEVLRAAGVGTVTTMVREGLAANTILDTAAEIGAGAIVMATRGHSGLGREVVGSVAEYVLRHAGGAAVVLVGPRAAGAAA
ncbi:MAG: universal stress protein, partial [Chloroflexi bacterium]|nr:universal stress protein [Chloroflexota bacterium]